MKIEAAYDRSTIGELPDTSRQDAFAALETAHALYEDRSAWLSAKDRIQILGRLASGVEARAEELALQAATEGGKPLKDSRVELGRAVTGIRTAASAISHLTGHEVPMNLDDRSMDRWAVTYREPRGVVLAISAFNHPFNLLIHQVVTAIAAGCPVLVKPARATPLSCASLMELLDEAGLPSGWCQMLLCDNDVSTALVGDERVAFLTFIGSAKVGWMLRSKLAPGADCALEHGGVAPVIVDETAYVSQAVPPLTKAAFYHAGQVCVSVQRVYAESSIVGDLSERLADAARGLTVGDPRSADTDVGPLIRPGEVDRVEEWVYEAVSKGAKLLCGGERLGKTTYAPTVLLDPPDDVRISREEVFGPVVCVYSYEDIDDAVRRANLSREYFQASLFSNRLDRVLDIGRRLHGMSVMINDHTAFRVDWMPFGGHRNSGLKLGGIEHSMRDMTIERMIVMKTS